MQSRKRKSDWISGTGKPPQEDGEKESRSHKKARSGEAGTGDNSFLPTGRNHTKQR